MIFSFKIAFRLGITSFAISIEFSFSLSNRCVDLPPGAAQASNAIIFLSLILICSKI
jgi:hypothetical protein